MTERAGRPTPEMVLLQKDLEKAKAALHQQEIIARHQRQQVERRLQEEVSKTCGICFYPL